LYGAAVSARTCVVERISTGAGLLQQLPLSFRLGGM
jgi:hypothetical protein